jgi:hypothetical protein
MTTRVCIYCGVRTDKVGSGGKPVCSAHGGWPPEWDETAAHQQAELDEARNRARMSMLRMDYWNGR